MAVLKAQVSTGCVNTQSDDYVCLIAFKLVVKQVESQRMCADVYSARKEAILWS